MRLLLQSSFAFAAFSSQVTVNAFTASSMPFKRALRQKVSGSIKNVSTQAFGIAAPRNNMNFKFLILSDSVPYLLYVLYNF